MPRSDAVLTASNKPIRCGSCKGTHNSVAEVRACFGAVKEPAATTGQVSYCQSLFRTKVPTAEFADMPEDRINAFSKKEASRFIDIMRAQPFKPKEREVELPHPEVPEGYYALVNDDRVVDFYKVVDLVDGGRALYQCYGSPGSLELRRVRTSDRITHVMDVISINPKEAAIRFGKELGVCGRCGSPLTSKFREIGIGPVCINKGW